MAVPGSFPSAEIRSKYDGQSCASMGNKNNSPKIYSGDETHLWAVGSLCQQPAWGREIPTSTVKPAQPSGILWKSLPAPATPQHNSPSSFFSLQGDCVCMCTTDGLSKKTPKSRKPWFRKRRHASLAGAFRMHSRAITPMKGFKVGADDLGGLFQPP